MGYRIMIGDQQTAVLSKFPGIKKLLVTASEETVAHSAIKVKLATIVSSITTSRAKEKSDRKKYGGAGVVALPKDPPKADIKPLEKLNVYLLVHLIQGDLTIVQPHLVKLAEFYDIYIVVDIRQSTLIPGQEEVLVSSWRPWLTRNNIPHKGLVIEPKEGANFYSPEFRGCGY